MVLSDEEKNKKRREHYAKNKKKIREQARKLRAKNPEKYREYGRKRREKYPEKIREQARKLYAKDPEKFRDQSREWRKNHPERYKGINRKSGLKTRKILKQEVFSHYANPLRCVCCGVKGIEFLTVDHIIPKRKMNDEKLIQAGFTVELKGEKLNRWLKNNNYPKGFQILCWNCNFAKGVLGQCPHQD